MLSSPFYSTNTEGGQWHCVNALSPRPATERTEKLTAVILGRVFTVRAGLSAWTLIASPKQESYKEDLNGCVGRYSSGRSFDILRTGL